MSCISFKQIHEGRSASDSLQDGKMSADIVQVFRAVTDDPYDDEFVIAEHEDCPSLGDPLVRTIGEGEEEETVETKCYLKSRSFTNQSFSKTVWHVTLTWGTGEREGGGGDPLQIEAKITWRSEQFQKPAVFDLNGYAIVNSAGDPFDPPPERDDSRWVATVVKNLAEVPLWLLDYQDAVNSVPFLIDGLEVEERKAKVQSIEISDWQYHPPGGNSTNVTSFRQVTIGISFCDDTYDLKVLDQGFNYLKPLYTIGGVNVYRSAKITIEDEQGNVTEPTSPMPLDGRGQAIKEKSDEPVIGGDGYPILYPARANSVFLVHRVYKERDFNLLPLV
jgi:hypothetical protein